MDDLSLEAYLDELSRRLRARGVQDPRVLEELEAHLLEAVSTSQRAGLSPEEARRRALERFGEAGVVAARFGTERSSMMHKVFLGVALAIGLLIAYVDSRPSWDDTGISALAIAVACGALGALGPERPWLWALAVGVWVPIFGVASAHNYGSLLALAFAFVGAYAGMALRRTLAPV